MFQQDSVNPNATDNSLARVQKHICTFEIPTGKQNFKRHALPGSSCVGYSLDLHVWTRKTVYVFGWLLRRRRRWQTWSRTVDTLLTLPPQDTCTRTLYYSSTILTSFKRYSLQPFYSRRFRYRRVIISCCSCSRAYMSCVMRFAQQHRRTELTIEYFSALREKLLLEKKTTLRGRKKFRGTAGLSKR